MIAGRERYRGVSGRNLAFAFGFVAIASIVPFAILGVSASVAVHRIAASQAKQEVQASADSSSQVAFGPLMTDALINGDQAAFDAFDRAVRVYMSKSNISRVKVWDKEGTVVYSDDPRQVGKRFALEPDQLALLGGASGIVDVNNLEKQENSLDTAGPSEKLLEVYIGERTETGVPLLFESYFPYELVDQRAAELRSGFLPPMLVALGVLTLIQVPVAILLALRVARYRRDREQLLEQVLDVSDMERRRIAAEVHDGAVQDLIGIAYSIEGAATRAEPRLAVALKDAALSTRRTIRSLRSLLTSIDPVEVPESGIAEGLADIVFDLRERGVSVEVDLPAQRLAPVDELLVLRAAREALRNVYSHAHATHVVVRLERAGGRLLLEIRDDGEGFTAEQAVDQRRAGHLGLELLSDFARESGGDLEVTSEVGVGTAVRLQLVST